MQEQTVRSLRIATYKLAITQLSVAILVGLIFLLAQDIDAGKAAVKGGLIAVIPNLMFALVYFRQSVGIDADTMLAQLRKANTIKLILTVILFSVVLSQKPAPIGALFTGYLLTLLTQWAAPVFFKH